jgi:hypothetical protein
MKLGSFFCAVGLCVIVSSLSWAVSRSDAGAQTVPARGSPDYHFGGYRWFGPVSEISASWREPRIRNASSSEDAHASTWIGVQPQAGGPPFIQLGTLEDVGYSGIAAYRVFWSDTSVDFHPQVVGSVHAGDVVSANLTATSSGWRLNFVDHRSGLKFDEPQDYGGGLVPNQAEWFQEDPDNGSDPTSELVYPQLSDTHFWALLVNGRPPKLNLRNGQVLLAENGYNGVPSPVHDDQFIVEAASGLASQYLTDARQLDSSATRFSEALSGWSQLSSEDQIVTAQTEAEAVALNITRLRALPVPAGDRSSFSALVNHLTQIHQDLLAWIHSGVTLNSATYEKLSHDLSENAKYANKMRTTLGIPPT